MSNPLALRLVPLIAPTPHTRVEQWQADPQSEAGGLVIAMTMCLTLSQGATSHEAHTHFESLSMASIRVLLRGLSDHFCSVRAEEVSWLPST